MSKHGENNLVAKYARKFNHACVFRDKTKYKRKAKHPKKNIDES